MKPLLDTLAANVRSQRQAKLDITVSRLRDRAVRRRVKGYGNVPVGLEDLYRLLDAVQPQTRVQP